MTHEHLSWPEDNIDAQSIYWWTIVHRAWVCPTQQKSHQMWLDESPLHQSAYQCLDMLYQGVAELENDPAFLARRRHALRPRPSTLKGVINWVKTSPMLGNRPAIGTMLVLTILVGSNTLWQTSSENTPPVAQQASVDVRSASTSDHSYRTSIGERSTIDLEDNSRVELSTETQVQVGMSPNVRSLVMHKGQALFDVAKDEDRPFIVHAGRHKIIALGTKFEVRMEGETVQVTLLEGKIDVIEPTQIVKGTAQQAPKIVSVLPKERYNSSSGEVEKLSTATADRLLSWRNGRLDFESEPLGQVVYEINRYSAQKIRIADPELHALPISGSFKVGSAKRFAEALTIAYSVKATSDQQDSEITLSK